MLATKTLFQTLMTALDAAVLGAGKLAERGDIHPAIHAIGEYAAAEAALEPVRTKLAKLEADKAKADLRLEALVKSAKPAETHKIGVLEAKLKKLAGDIERNEAAAALEKPVAKTPAPNPLGIKVPATRWEIVAELREQLAAVEKELTELLAAPKKLATAVKAATTRQSNLATKIDEARKVLVAHDGKLEEVIRLMRKTIKKLTTGIERKAARAASLTTEPGFENPDGSSIQFKNVRLEPLPLDVRAKAWAEMNLGPVVTDADLEFARREYAAAHQ